MVWDGILCQHFHYGRLKTILPALFWEIPYQYVARPIPITMHTWLLEQAAHGFQLRMCQKPYIWSAALCPDPLGSLQHSPHLLAVFGEGFPRTGSGYKGTGGKGEGGKKEGKEKEKVPYHQFFFHFLAETEIGIVFCLYRCSLDYSVEYQISLELHCHHLSCLCFVQLITNSITSVLSETCFKPA